jgi:HPt (histidine-containing phosphotransfer) domain-containing protein
MSDMPVVDDGALERLVRLGGPTLLREMIELYLTHGSERIAALDAGLAADDARAVQRAVHSLKSSAGNLGARRLQHTAEAVEAAATGGVIDAELTDRLKREYQESATRLRAAMEAYDG